MTRYACTGGGPVCFCDKCDAAELATVRVASAESAPFADFVVKMAAERARRAQETRSGAQAFDDTDWTEPPASEPRGVPREPRPAGYSRSGKVANPRTFSRPRVDRDVLHAAALAAGGVELDLQDGIVDARPKSRATPPKSWALRVQLAADLIALGVLEMRGGGDESPPRMWRVADVDESATVKHRPVTQHTTTWGTSMACTDGVWAITQRIGRDALTLMESKR